MTPLRNLPIRRKLTAVILLTSAAVLLLTCSAFFAYEFFTFRQTMVRNISTLGEVIASNSTAALDFDNRADATEILRALKAERHVVAAGLYDTNGKLFAQYPADLPATGFPTAPEVDGYRFAASHLAAFLPVKLSTRRIGTLYLQSDMEAMYERFRLYGAIAALVVAGSFGLAYFLSRTLQEQISGPILTLADTARAIREREDYSVRAKPQGQDELGLLTGAFNQMLDQIQLRDDSLRTSEVRFRSLVTATAQIVWHTDSHGQVAGPLPSWQAYTGQDEAAIQGTGWAAALHPEDTARALAVWGKAVETRGNYEVDYRIRRHDGEYRYFVARGVPVLNEAGEIREWVGTCTDIHDRRLAEEALRESEGRFRSMANSIPQLAWTAKADGFIDWYNQRWYQYTGTTPKQMEGWGWQGVHDPEVLPKVMVNWQAAISSGQAFEMEFPLRGADGRFRTFLTRVEPLKDSEGRVVQWFGTNTDVEGLKQAEAARGRLAAIVESAEDAIVSRDLNGTVLSWNPGAEHLFGYSAMEVLGKNVTLLIPPDRAQEEAEFTAKVLLGEKINQFETVRLKKDGTHVEVTVTVSPVKDPAGRVIGASKILRDITDRKRAEEKLKASADDLRRSNEELERFAYVASHDLQEPLRTVASFAQLLGRRFKGRLDSDADEFIQFIVDGANRMQTLINDLLSFSRVGTKGKPFEPVAADHVLQSVLHDLNGSITDNGAAVTHDPLPEVMADPVQFRQVLQNLIGNAIKFHKQGEPPRVHVSATLRNGQWEFRVRDSGIGIDPQYFERVFIIFQRLHGKEEYAGTGIGLAVCKKIVERHSGRIWVESERGVGSTFCFTLPNRKASL